MARPRSSERIWTENCTSVDIGQCPFLKGSEGAAQSVTMTVDQTDPPQQSRYRIPLTATRPHFGGIRWWFVCPECRRRCAKLYASDADSALLCRVCRRLVYGSQYRPPLPWFLRQLRKHIESMQRSARHRRP